MLVRFDPIYDVDRAFRQLWGGDGVAKSGIHMDAYRRGDEVVVHLDMPGVEADSIEVTTDKGALTVAATRPYPALEGDQVMCRERQQEFSRQIVVSETLDLDAIVAKYEHGVLTLHIPIRESAKPRRVEIQTEPEKELAVAAT